MPGMSHQAAQNGYCAPLTPRGRQDGLCGGEGCGQPRLWWECKVRLVGSAVARRFDLLRAACRCELQDGRANGRLDLLVMGSPRIGPMITAIESPSIGSPTMWSFQLHRL